MHMNECERARKTVIMGMEEESERKREVGSRKEKRKAAKKMRRKKRRQDNAEMARLEEEARLNDPEEQRKMLLLEQQEAERMQRDRIAFEESERAWMIKHQLLLQQQLEDADNNNNNNNNGVEEDESEKEEDEDDGPPEIIWRGNEIIIKKKKKKANSLLQRHQEHHECDNNNRPTSNPFPPESPSQPHSSSPTLENVAQQLPNFGTELDKAHCPFHLKTGACRFGERCSRVHFYPDKSSTLLIKNMYNGPGLAWEQDEGLEYTEEEVEFCFKEFYDDVHTEFLKFGELVNFKVCKNGSFHLRGNVYVQYKLLDSALRAYNSVNGRYFAGKQVSCKFVNLTRWKVAICGEYMKSGYKTCSHGTACNFIHCFRNPGGDYEWADSDKPPPNFWVKQMAALFGHSDDYEISRVHGNLCVLNPSSNVSKTDSDRYHSRRSRSRELGQLNGGRSGRRIQEDEKKQRTPDEERNTNHKRKCRNGTPDTDTEWSEGVDREKYHEHTRESSFNRNRDSDSRRHEEYSDVNWVNRDSEKQHDRKGRSSRKWNQDSRDWIYEAGSDEDRVRRRHHSSQRKGSRHQSRDNRNRTDESESDEDRAHEEYSDVDWDTTIRHHENQHDEKGRNSQIYETESDEDRHRKRYYRSQMKEARHRSRDNSYVTDESESDKDREMETQHNYSRKKSRHKRSGLQDYRKDCDNENDKVDGDWSQGESDPQAHHHKKKRL